MARINGGTSLYLGHNLSDEQLSKWKQQVVENAASLFESSGKPSKDATERITQLEQHFGRLAVALDTQKKALTWLNETDRKNEK